jgi:hypothetical protein
VGVWLEGVQLTHFKPVPVQLTAAQIAEHGPGDSCNISLSSFKFTNIQLHPLFECSVVPEENPTTTQAKYKIMLCDATVKSEKDVSDLGAEKSLNVLVASLAGDRCNIRSHAEPPSVLRLLFYLGVGLALLAGSYWLFKFRTTGKASRRSELVSRAITSTGIDKKAFEDLIDDAVKHHQIKKREQDKRK